MTQKKFISTFTALLSKNHIKNKARIYKPTIQRTRIYTKNPLKLHIFEISNHVLNITSALKPIVSKLIPKQQDVA